MAGHFHQTNLSGAMVTSPLAVDFRCFMTRQSPHIIYRQAGCLVRLQCQWGEPVKGHKWEEASIIDWVLVSGIEKKMWKWLSCLKVEACTEVLCWGSPLRLLERSRAFACQGWRKVNHTRGVWTVICMFFTEIWDQREKKKFRGSLSVSICSKHCCLSLGDKFPPFTVASCYCINIQHIRQQIQQKLCFMCMSLNGYLSVNLSVSLYFHLYHLLTSGSHYMNFNTIFVYLWVLRKGFRSCRLCRYLPRLFGPFSTGASASSSSSSGSGWGEDSGKPSTRPASSRTSGNMADPLGIERQNYIITNTS